MEATIDIKPNLMVHAKGAGSMEGAEGVHVGTVDHLDGDYIKLKKSDSKDDQHHWIPISWVESVDGKAVHLSKTEAQFRKGVRSKRPELH